MNKKILAVIVIVLLIIALILQFIDIGSLGPILQMVIVAVAATLGFLVFGKGKNYQ
ncbi:MAG TPA: hypothetical protein P5274_00665 [Candidatus Paceibacterota bacterium]|nr:hypothetical protein [Candidatus Paceibacterota bacterium]